MGDCINTRNVYVAETYLHFYPHMTKATLPVAGSLLNANIWINSIKKGFASHPSKCHTFFCGCKQKIVVLCEILNFFKKRLSPNTS